MEENKNNGNFVPSYAKDSSETNELKKEKNKEKKDKKDKKIKSKISKTILIMLAIFIILIIAIAIYKLVVNNFNKTNVNYLENMEAYGFDVMYDNKTAEPTETVTKSEAIKMVVTSMLNESDITKIVEVREYIEDYQDTMTEKQIEEKLEYKNKLWVAYAVSIGIIQKNEITAENENEFATYLDVLVYFANAKIKILNEVLDVENTPNINNFESYRVSEQLALSDMVYNGLIDEKVKGLDETLTKEKLNKLIIDMVLKYNTITVNGEKININKDKEPSNVEEYPYTLASINKSIYELENYVKNDKYKNAKESYAGIKKYYYAINSLIQDYMNTILNVDYNNFNESEFTNDILDLSFHYEGSDNVKKYAEYVRTNKIKISGSAKVQYPAIYFDGEAYRVRVKVDYKIENTLNRENLLYGDLKSKNAISYNKDEDSIIVDVPIKKSLVNELLYVELRPLNNIKAGSVKSDVENLIQNDVINNETNNTNVTVPKSEEIEYTNSNIVQEGNKIIVTPQQ